MKRFFGTLVCLGWTFALWGQGYDLPQKQRFPRVQLSSVEATEAFSWWSLEHAYPREIRWTHQAS